MTRQPNARGRRTIAAVEKAAVDLAKHIPLDEITVQLICREAGVSERVFFNHFPVREDAFLGRESPRIDEKWAERYVSDPQVPLITGAARLVTLPPVAPEIGRLRTELAANNPALLSRAYGRLIPVREECVSIVGLALAARRPHLTTGGRAAAAKVIVGAAAELIQASVDDLAAVADALSESALV